MRHPNTDSLIDFAEGWLSTNSKESIAQHLGTCTVCAKEASEWFSLLSALKHSCLQSAPLHTIRICESIYHISKPVSKLRQILATVVFDSTIVPATAGVRGVSSSQQILLRSDEYDVHLRVGGAPRIILGQILPRQAGDFVSGARVGVIRNEQQLAVTVTDEVGEFRIGTAPAGHLRFQADIPANQRILADFTIKEMINE